jgi:hypothetical protein
MKNLILTSLLCFSFFTAYTAYAQNLNKNPGTGNGGGQTTTITANTGNTQLTANYPAAGGSYNQINIRTQTGGTGTNVNCASPANAGLLFMDPSNNLSLCSNGQATAVPFPEKCFNRFWVGGTNTPPGTGGCGAGYSQATINQIAMVDTFTTGGFTVKTTVCCNNNSTVLPNT